MINGKFATAGTIKFLADVSEDKVREIVQILKPSWERKFPGTWVDSHIRGAGDDDSFLYAFTRLSDGSWCGSYANEIIRSLRGLLGVDAHNRPIGVHSWTICSDAEAV